MKLIEGRVKSVNGNKVRVRPTVSVETLVAWYAGKNVRNT
jgi:hypothetical protein